MKALRRPGLPALALAVAALAAWIVVPGSTTVLAAQADRVAVSAAAPARAFCNPAASLRPAGPPRVTPGSFMARIRARGYLIAGVDQSTYHFGYLNPLDGKIEGFDIDMARAVARAIFGSPDKIEFRAISDEQRIPDIQSGAVDIVAHTMTITCARLAQVDFSTVYYAAGQRVLVQSDSSAKSIADLGRKKVCATTGSTSLTSIAAAKSHPIPVAVPYWTDCLVLLQQGDVAAISTDDSILAGLAAQDPWTKIIGPSFSSEPYGLAISRQHPDFVRFVNAVLQQLRTNGQWAASYAHWVGTPVPEPPAARYKD